MGLVNAFKATLKPISKPPEAVCRGNRISPCKLRDLRVSVLKLLRKRSTTEARRTRRNLFPTDSFSWVSPGDHCRFINRFNGFDRAMKPLKRLSA